MDSINSTVESISQQILPQVKAELQQKPEFQHLTKPQDPRVKGGINTSLLDSLLPQLLPLTLHYAIQTFGPQLLSLAEQYIEQFQSFMTPEDFQKLKDFLHALDPSGQTPLIRRLFHG
jgi:hypothetical protein